MRSSTTQYKGNELIFFPPLQLLRISFLIHLGIFSFFNFLFILLIRLTLFPLFSLTLLYKYVCSLSMLIDENKRILFSLHMVLELYKKLGLVFLRVVNSNNISDNRVSLWSHYSHREAFSEVIDAVEIPSSKTSSSPKTQSMSSWVILDFRKIIDVILVTKIGTSSLMMSLSLKIPLFSPLPSVLMFRMSYMSLLSYDLSISLLHLRLLCLDHFKFILVVLVLL